jgi:DNA (cytosine-5)-methyltransferase 1
MKVVSLFSGPGGLDLGFIQAGHKIIWANDIAKDAVETYRRNIGDHIVHENITLLPLDAIPDSDLIIGSFPAKGFSLARTRSRMDDTRNVLYLELLRVLETRRPKFFLAETAKGVMDPYRGEVFRRILSDFALIGYRTSHVLLNAADFGVPQLRERLYVVGMLRGVRRRFTEPTPTHCADPVREQEPWVTVGEALAGLPDPDAPNDLPNHDYSKGKFPIKGYMGPRLTHLNRPAQTLTMRGDVMDEALILHHPVTRRRMTGREMATLQGFPLDYAFCGTRPSVYRQIVNAVPPPLAKAIALGFPR